MVGLKKHMKNLEFFLCYRFFSPFYRKIWLAM